jgi:ribosome maturation factor RimP
VTVAVGPAGRTQEVTGRVTAVDEAGVSLAVEVQGKPGAKKRPPTPREVAWAELGTGRVQVEFGRSAPEDDAPADETDELVDDELTDDSEFDDDDIERDGVPQARGGAQ